MDIETTKNYMLLDQLLEEKIRTLRTEAYKLAAKRRSIKKQLTTDSIQAVQEADSVVDAWTQKSLDELTREVFQDSIGMEQLTKRMTGDVK